MKLNLGALYIYIINFVDGLWKNNQDKKLYEKIVNLGESSSIFGIMFNNSLLLIFSFRNYI